MSGNHLHIAPTSGDVVSLGGYDVLSVRGFLKEDCRIDLNLLL